MKNPYDFTGKKILVTGATSGIGRATAVMLSEQGAKVVILARDRERAETSLKMLSGEGHGYYIKDLGDTDGFKEVFDEIVSDGIKLDGIAHCAGMVKVLPLNALNYSNMDESMRVNFYSMVELAKVFAKKKYHNENSAFVTVSSIAAEYPGKCQSLYAATKAAVNVVTQSLSMELGAKGIRINSVMPASVNTRMMQAVNENRDAGLSDKVIEKQVLGLEEPEDIADIILFLLSNASGKITGRSIYADAGYVNF